MLSDTVPLNKRGAGQSIFSYYPLWALERGLARIITGNFEFSVAIAQKQFPIIFHFMRRLEERVDHLEAAGRT